MSVEKQPGEPGDTEPPDIKIHSTSQYVSEQKSDIMTECGKRSFLIAKEKKSANPSDHWDEGMDEILDKYSDPLGRGEKSGACYLRGFNANGELDEERKYLSYLPHNYNVPKEIFDQAEQSTGCVNIRNLLETVRPEMIRAEMGFRRLNIGKEAGVGFQHVSMETVETEMKEKLNAWLAGVRYQQCKRRCHNRKTCERKKKDLDAYVEYVKESEYIKKSEYELSPE